MQQFSPFTVARRALLPAIALGVGAAMFGCQGQEPVVQTPYLPAAIEHEEPAMPTYAELAQRYNANAEKLDRLRATTVVSMRWEDEEGDRHYEQGEGRLLFTEPGRTAMTVGKLGDVKLWAGSDADRYWVFDMRESGTAYVGEHENLGQGCAARLPLPVNPRAVPYLIGLLPLDESLADMAPPVEMLRGHYLIEPPGTNVRMLLHPETALPVRVDLTDEQGRSVVITLLEDYGAVEQEGVAPEAAARVARRVAFHAVGDEAELTLHLADLTDGRRFDTIPDEAFQYDAIAAQYQPAETVDLDEACNADADGDAEVQEDVDQTQDAEAADGEA